MNSRSCIFAICLFVSCSSVVEAAPVPVIEAITFAVEPGQLYFPLVEAASALGWPLRTDDAAPVILLHDSVFPVGYLRHLVDGTPLISADDLRRAGAEVCTSPEVGCTINSGDSRFTPMIGVKRVEIHLKDQRLWAWQGTRLVLQSRISSGRNGRTPEGDFTAGPYRARMHYSSRYLFAPMPWSVQIYGHVFVHGFTSVPNYPASHGCIRLPLNEGNPAKFFYEWVDNGTPVRVAQ